MFDTVCCPTNHILTLCEPERRIEIHLLSDSSSYTWDVQEMTIDGPALGCSLRWPLEIVGLNGNRFGAISMGPHSKNGTVTVKATVSYQSLDPYQAVETLIHYVSFEVKKDGGCSGKCSQDFGSGSTENDCPYVRFNLGMYSSQQDAGTLELDSHAAYTNLCQPIGLYVPYTRSGPYGSIDVITNNSGVRQVKAPQGLVDVLHVNAWKYQLLMFTNAGAFTNGLYTTNGSALVSWTIENPDGVSSSNRLAITENLSGISRQMIYIATNDSGTIKWTMDDGAGLRTIKAWEEPDTSYRTNQIREVRVGGTLVQRTVKTYDFSVGDPRIAGSPGRRRRQPDKHHSV